MAMETPPRCTEDTFHSARVAGADALAPPGDVSARPPLSFLKRVSFNGSHEPRFSIHLGRKLTRMLRHPHSSGTVPMNGREQTQELQVTRPQTRAPSQQTAGSRPKNCSSRR